MSQKQFLITACVIVLSALVLASFSLLAMRNQRQGMERERERRADVLAGGILEQIGRTLSGLEAAAEAVGRGLSGSGRGGALPAESGGQFPVEAVFKLSQDGAVTVPVLPWGGASVRTASLRSDFKRSFDSAEELEIQGKTAEAIAAYEKLMPLQGGSGEQAVLLNARARCYQKAGRLNEALETYRLMIRSCLAEPAQNGTCLGTVAYLQAATIEMQQKQFNSSLQTCCALLNDLVTGRIPASRAECEYYLQRADELVGGIPGFAGDQQPRGEYARSRALLSNLLAADRVAGAVRRDPARYRAGTGVWSYHDMDAQALLGVRQADAAGDRLVFSISRDVLRARWREAAQQVLQYTDGCDYEVRDAAQAVFIATAGGRLVPPVIRRGVAPDRLPGWEVAVSVRESPALQAGARLRRLVTGGLVCVLLLAIGASLYFMNVMVRRTAELSAMKTDFVSAVSHEMRTPLATIRMIAEMFQMQRVKDLQMSREYIETVAGEADRLTRLINKVLDFSRMDSGRKPYTFRPTELATLVDATARTFEAGVAGDGYRVLLSIEPELPPVCVDEDAMVQVLVNLLDNAVKYSPENREIRVSLKRQHREVVLEVADQGIGIDPRKVDKIFEKFYRGEDELTRRTKGTGIGLAIVKHIVDAHRGSIEVRSVRGQGSVFAVRLPVDGEPGKV